MKESVLFWPVHLKGRTLYILDETKIPQRVVYLKVRHYHQAIDAVVTMKTRAFGQFLTVCYTFMLEMQKAQGLSADAQMRLLERVAGAFNRSRPTFPFEEVTGMVLGIARKVLRSPRFRQDFISAMNGFLEQGIRQKRYQRAREAAALIKNGDTVLTHCNVSGELPLVAEFCRKEKKKIRFLATETRPYFQGSRLTAWELKREGFDVTLIPDNAAAKVMADGDVDCVLVGSDRSAANGDFANKVGTYQIALLARHFGIPFYVLVQSSDKLSSGRQIPIEVRRDEEILCFAGKRLAPEGAAAFYPGFDVVPHQWVTKHIAIHAH
jgi:methylthioribose-1-phosphate isomerase